MNELRKELEDKGIDVGDRRILGRCKNCGEVLVEVEGIPVHPCGDEDPSSYDFGWGQCLYGDTTAEVRTNRLVALAGNLEGGFEAYGPFDTFVDAATQTPGEDVWVMELKDPDDVDGSV